MSKNNGSAVALLLVSVASAALAAAFEYPMDVAIDDKGHFYVSDPNSYSIYRITPGQKLSTLAQGKALYRSPLYRVHGICLDNQYQVIAADPASSEGVARQSGR
jgi:hypothetical protein